MGGQGRNAGGFAYMTWVVCPLCGRKGPIGLDRLRRGDTACRSKTDCQKRADKKAKKKAEPNQ